jgi:hypothetical protein
MGKPIRPDPFSTGPFFLKQYKYKTLRFSLVLSKQNPKKMACTIDFRGLDEGFGGKTYKRKRAEAEHNLVSGSASMDIDEEYTFQPATKRSAMASAENPDKPSFGKPSYDGVISGRVSGRNWKQPRKHRASATQVRKGTPFEERARDKEIKKAYKERMTELKETIRQNKIEKRKAREKREKTKKENILKSGTKLQKITNPKTLKKIAKSKHKNLLKVVPDDMFNKKK